MPAEIIKRGVKLEAIEGSQAVRKRTNSRRRLLYRLLGGRLVLRLITYYKIPERTGKTPRVRWWQLTTCGKPRALRLSKGKLLKN